MQKRQLGKSSTAVSAIGIGAMSLTNFYGPIDKRQSHAILKKALDLGINHLDTSNMYGNGLSEERIGSFLTNQGSHRNSLFKIATKAGVTRDANGNRVFNNSSKHLEAELEKSLKRLGVDQVELFYIHRRDPNCSIEEVTETLVRLVKSGKICQFGFSEIAPTSLALASAVHPVAAVQSEYSLSTRSPEMGLVQETAKCGASLVAFSPVGRSLLTNEPHSLEKSQTMDFLKGNPRFQKLNLSRNIKATEGFRELANAIGTHASSLAIAWLLHQGEHIIPIPGTRSTTHLEELAEGASLKLSDDTLVAIDRLLPIGWAHGDRYSVDQWVGPEKYC